MRLRTGTWPWSRRAGRNCSGWPPRSRWGGDGPEGGIDRAAEVALFVSDRWQHTGVGTLLLEHLAAAARAAGADRFEALVLTENLAVFDVFAHAGFTVHRELPSGGVIVLGIDLEGSPALAMAVAERERLATVASVAHLLRPSSVIVVGASRGAREVGHAVLRNIQAGGFTGRLAAVNRHVRPGQAIAGVPAFRSVAEVPFAAELAVVAVPATAVPGVLEDCGRAGVRGAVVLTAGFAEAGHAEEQAEVVRIAHRHGMRMIGPNCLGVLNTDPAIRLNATFGRVTAEPWTAEASPSRLSPVPWASRCSTPSADAGSASPASCPSATRRT